MATLGGTADADDTPIAIILSKGYFRAMSTHVDPAAPWPVRRITNPAELKALAHPVRFAIVDLLAEGPLTATQCAERLGETPANCSYHLRQLAKYGHVTPAAGGHGRERYWKAREEAITFDETGPGAAAAARAVTDAVDAYRFSAWERFKARRSQEPEPWRELAGSMDAVMWMNAEELAEFTSRLYALIAPYAERMADESTRPADARAIRFFTYTFPGERS